MNLLKEKEILVDSMKRQLNELREDLHQKEVEIDNGMRRWLEDERDKGIFERKEKSKLQKELEHIEKSYQELEAQRKRDIAVRDDEFESLQKKHRVMCEERNIYLQKT